MSWVQETNQSVTGRSSPLVICASARPTISRGRELAWQLEACHRKWVPVIFDSVNWPCDGDEGMKDESKRHQATQSDVLKSATAHP